MKKKMRKGLFMWAVVATMFVATGCDSWFDVDMPEDKVSYLEEDVYFVATSVICKHFTNVYAQYPDHENYFIELLGEDNGGVRDVMILDLLVPAKNPILEHEYLVGYKGEFIALSKYDVYDPYTGIQYMGGCYYARAKDGLISDYYGFLTEGSVLIYTIEDKYHISVNAKSLDHNVKVSYSGPLTVVEGKLEHTIQ